MEEEPVEGASPDDKGAIREQRNQRIIDYCNENPHLSVERIAEIFGLSAPSIRLITANKIEGRKRGRKPALSDAQKIVGPLHAQVGARFYSHVSFTKMRSTAQAAEELGWSAQKVSAIGKGQWDLSLTDLKLMAEYMGISMSKLLDDF